MAKAKSTQSKSVAAKGNGKDKSTRIESAPIERESFRQLYQKMLEIRRFEEKVGQLYGMGLIGGFCHLYIGQEAVAVGTQANLETGDSTLTSYRDHGHALLCGLSMNEIMAELTGRAAGCSSGKGGSMHMFCAR